MTNKVRENFFILLFSNIITIALVLLFNTFWKEANELNPAGSEIFSLLNVPYYLIFAIVVSFLLCMIKDSSKSDIIVNNNIQPVQICSNVVETDNAEAIREKYSQEIKKRKNDTISAIVSYTYRVFSPYMKDEDLDVLCQNIRIFEVPDTELTPVLTNGNLSTLDLRHYAWNIGERLGWSGRDRALFIKTCFPQELRDLEIDSIRRTLRTRGKCTIDIDAPDDDNYNFHYDKQKQ